MLPPVGFSIDEYKLNKPRGRPIVERNEFGDAVICLGAAEEGLVSSEKLSGQEGVLVGRILLLTLTLTISSK